MSLTLKQRREWALIVGAIYRDQSMLTRQLVDFNVQLARDEVYKRWIAISEYNFRKTVSIADGAQLPTDYSVSAGNSFQTGTPPLPVVYIEVPLIAASGINTFLLADTGSPKWFISDQRIRTLPVGLTFNLEYYWRPIQLFYKDNSVKTNAQIDALTDNMPPETEALIMRGTLERNIQILVGRKEAQGLLQSRQAEAEEAAAKFFADVTGYLLTPSIEKQ